MERIQLLVLCLSFAAPATARADASIENRWRTGADAKRSIRDWRRCREIAAKLELDNDDARLSVRSLPNGLEAQVADEGSGRWAYGACTTLRLVRGRCDAVGFVVEGGKESMTMGLRRISVGGAPLPTLSEIAKWDKAVLVEDPDRPELAAARLLVQLAQQDEGPPTGAAHSGPPWPAQPEHAGRPTGAPPAIWTPRMLKAAGVAHPWLENEDGTAFDAIDQVRVRPPRLLRTVGPWEIWELRFRARLGGGLLAVYDKRSNLHRWIWATAYDDGAPRRSGQTILDSSDFRIVDVKGDSLLVLNTFEDAESLWRIDLKTGVARRARRGP